MSSQPQITYGYRVLHRVHCPSNRTWFQPDSRTLPSSMLHSRTQASGMISQIAGSAECVHCPCRPMDPPGADISVYILSSLSHFLSQAYLLHGRFPRIWTILWSCLRVGVTGGRNVTGHIFSLPVPAVLASDQAPGSSTLSKGLSPWLLGFWSLARVLEPRCH